MAKKDRLIKSKSIYTIKKTHSLTNDATIYENDHITIIPNDGIYDEDMALFSESNFKYRIRTEKNEKKKHARSNYLKSDTGGEFWTLNNISGTTLSDESRIITKPNYNSLKDFAYYGSATELIRATVNDIIQRFPGGITNYDEEHKKIAPKVNINGDEYTLLSNEFEIDCWTGGGVIASGDVKNPMRVLAASYMNYEDNGVPLTEPPIFSASTSICPNSIIGDVSINGKFFPLYMDAKGKKYLLDNGKEINLKPKQEFIDAFWNSLDDFERVLLSRDTNPVYKAVFETPYSDETGYYYSNKSYVWPTVNDDGFTPDISTGNFQAYLASLVDLATFHDEYDSDNIWRMMTHESIKNLNWTFVSRDGDNENDLSEIDTKGIGAMIRVYGRQFDDIKRYADNIKASNSISYDEKNNVPDYFLTDIVENDGWEAQHIAPFENEKLDPIDSGGVVTYTSGKTPSYVNSEFQRRLALNSNYIQSLKGTRRGISTILGMFGYTETAEATSGKGEFSITEYVAVVSSALPYTEAYTIRTMGGDYVNVDEETNFMKGYPVAVVKPAVSGMAEYLVPWYDKNEAYDYPFYFQSKGGWGKKTSKEINLTELTSATTLNGNFIYGETQPYMKYANTIDDMLSIDSSELIEGSICYVADISDIEKQYTPADNDGGELSHYFILKNKALAGYCGFVDNDLYKCYGWKNVYNEEISGLTGDGPKVVYLESLKSEFRGNNPHVGYGQYDDGEEYIRHFQNLFEGSFNDGKYDYLENSESIIGGLNISGSALYDNLADDGYGFKFENTECEDNTKCHFFIDSFEENNLISFQKEDGWTYPSDFKTFNPESVPSINGILDESQANGIVNTKKLVINFGIGGDIEMKHYIENVVLKYLEPMIPSTSILEYRFDGKVEAIPSETITPKGGSFERLDNIAHILINNSSANTITSVYSNEENKSENN